MKELLSSGVQMELVSNGAIGESGSGGSTVVNAVNVTSTCDINSATSNLQVVPGRVKIDSESQTQCDGVLLQSSIETIPHSISAFERQLSKYVVALRPWSFTASFTPVALGSVLAYKTTGSFDIAVFFISLLTAVSVHAAGNLVNTYYDYCRGIDSKKSDDRTLVDQILTPADVAFLGGAFYVAGCLGFLILVLISPAKMEHLALVYFGGLSSSFLYTGGLGLKYMAMGDLVIFLTFGPITVMFSFLSQAGELSVLPVLYAIPIALNTEAILHCNNTRDLEADRKAGIVTLAILLGQVGSYFLFALLLFVPYLVFILLGIHFTKWMFLPATSIFFAFRLERDFRQMQMENLPRKAAKLNLLLGILYVCACYLTESSNLPQLI